MKRTVAIVLSALILACTLTGCGNNIQKLDRPITENPSQASDSETAAPASDDSDGKDSPFKTNDKVGVVFAGETITVTYRGNPAAYLYDSLDKGVYKYMNIYFTYEKASMDDAGAICFETQGDGIVSSLIQFDDYELTDGTVTFGENGFPMTCVFSGTEEEVAGILAGVDMKGMVTVRDSLGNSYNVAYVKDAVAED